MMTDLPWGYAAGAVLFCVLVVGLLAIAAFRLLVGDLD
jgi:hypothetical protein